jgi:hypothetical protein
MIDPYFWKSEKFFKKIFSACQILYPQKSKKWYLNFSRTVRLFYISLWNFADDEGILLLNLAQIKGDCLSFDDDFDESMIKDCIKVLNISKRIYLYENSEIKYGIICNFKEHQTISHPTPTKYPFPNEIEFREWFTEPLANDSRMTPSQVKLSKVKLSKDKTKDTSAPEGGNVDNSVQNQPNQPHDTGTSKKQVKEFISGKTGFGKGGDDGKRASDAFREEVKSVVLTWIKKLKEWGFMADDGDENMELNKWFGLFLNLIRYGVARRPKEIMNFRGNFTEPKTAIVLIGRLSKPRDPTREIIDAFRKQPQYLP